MKKNIQVTINFIIKGLQTDMIISVISVTATTNK